MYINSHWWSPESLIIISKISQENKKRKEKIIEEIRHVTEKGKLHINSHEFIYFRVRELINLDNFIEIEAITISYSLA